MYFPEPLYFFVSQQQCMVQVIHRYHGFYPFGLGKQSENTFLLILKEDLTEKEIALYRQKNKILKEAACGTLIKIQRILKEDNKLHLIYQYYPTSLQEYVQTIRNQTKTPKEKCKALTTEFASGIDSTINQLIKMEIKADILLTNLGVACKEKDALQLKVFIEPESEFLALIDHQYRPKQWKRKDLSTNNQEFLSEFYEAERKRLVMEFQQLLEQHFGKVSEPEKKQMPNFVINGTKLLFINPDKEEGTKSSKIEVPKLKDAKEKMERKVEEVTKVEQETRQNVPSPHQSNKKIENEKPQPQKKKIERIVNFDQSFEPEFKPQEFTNQNTYILEENEYLQSLEEQLVRLANEKHVCINPRLKLPKAQQAQQPAQKTSKNKEESTSQQKKINDSQKSIKSQKSATKKANHQSSSNSINQNQNNSNASSNQGNNSVEGLEICRCQPNKETAIIQEKVFKYKMKIITSHEIEIEGDGEPNVQQIQREIMEGIKSGKLNINDLAANKKTSQNRSTQLNHSNNSNENSKEMMTGSAHTQKSAPQSNFMKDNGGKIVQSNHQGSKRESCLNTNPQVLQTRSSDLQQAKMRSINEIIQKIGIRTNQAQNLHDSKQSKQSKQSRQAKLSPMQQEELKNVNIPTTPHYKTEKMELHEQKPQRAENYLQKIKEAKEKAQQILRQYTKKKQ